MQSHGRRDRPAGDIAGSGRCRNYRLQDRSKPDRPCRRRSATFARKQRWPARFEACSWLEQRQEYKPANRTRRGRVRSISPGEACPIVLVLKLFEKSDLPPVRDTRMGGRMRARGQFTNAVKSQRVESIARARLVPGVTRSILTRFPEMGLVFARFRRKGFGREWRTAPSCGWV